MRASKFLELVDRRVLVRIQSSKLEGSVILIRKAPTICSNTGMQSMDYNSLHRRGEGSTSQITHEAYEPAEMRRYSDCSPRVIRIYGQGGFQLVADCIIGGDECDWDYFHSAIKM